MTDDELANIERLWTSDAVAPFSSAIEVCPHSGPRDLNADGEVMYKQVLDLLAEVKRLRALVHVWTREKPTAPGAYWLRSEWLTGDQALLVEVEDATGELGFHIGTVHRYVADADGQWAGPLVPPQD